MKKLYFILLFCIPFLNLCAQQTWRQLPDFPGGARYAGISLVANGKVYVGLGTNFNVAGPMNDWWEYDPSSETWTRKANFPELVYYLSGFSINGKCYVGLGSDKTYAHHKTWYEYDPVLNTWTRKKDFPAPGRYGTADFVIDSIGYIYGGNKGTDQGPFLKSLWSYNPVTDQWIQKASLSAKSRSTSAGFSINGKGYIEGGFRLNQNDQYKFFDNLYEYDPASDAWTEKTSFPGGKEAAEACFVINDKAYVGLGQYKSNYNKTFYAYDPSTDTWSDSISEFPADGRELSCSFSLNNTGYVMLGYNPNKAGYYDDVWQLSTAGNNAAKLSHNERSLIQYEVKGHILYPLQFTQTNAILDFRLYDVVGRLILSKMINGHDLINLDSRVTPGIYMIVTSDGKENVSQEIFIQ